MALTSEEMKKIEEEERYRGGLRKKHEELTDSNLTKTQVHFKEEQKSPWWKPKGAGAWGCLIIIIIFIIIPSVIRSLSPSSNDNKQKGNTTEKTTKQEVKNEIKQTQASVNFTGTQFIITNKNDFDWERVDIVINEEYRYETGGMKAGSTYEVGAAQFTDKKYNRFDPFEIKPTEIRIYVKEPTSEDWYGELN